MTPVFCCGFECGTIGSHWTSGGGTIGTSTVRSDQRSARCNGSPAATSLTMSLLANAARWVGRLYIYFVTVPSADTRLVQIDTSGAGPNVRFKQSDSSLYAGVGVTLGASGVVVTTGQWYLVDFDFNINTGGNDTCDVQINGTACGQASATGLGVTDHIFAIGSQTSTTHDIFFDDVILSNTAGDYPIGAGKVLGFVPNVDGTHTSTSTNIVKGTTGAPTGGGAITSSTTDAFNRINARPIGGGVADSTFLINQQTNASTEYVEVGFEDTTEVNAPRAVEVITADRQAATQTGNFQTKLNDNGTENAIANRGTVAGVTSDRYVVKQYATAPADSTAWTLARFNGLKARFGYSSDAAPDQYWRGIMIEAEFPESLPAGMYGEPDGPRGQSLMAQLLAQ